MFVTEEITKLWKFSRKRGLFGACLPRNRRRLVQEARLECLPFPEGGLGRLSVTESPAFFTARRSGQDVRRMARRAPGGHAFRRRRRRTSSALDHSARALAADTESALASSAAELWPKWRVGRRTGDTTSTERRKLAERPPEALVTTPESITLCSVSRRFSHHFRSVKLVVMDEWHELLSTKRGVLRRTRPVPPPHLSPDLRTWGLSATLGNIPEAARTLGGYLPGGPERPMRIVRGRIPKTLEIETILPPNAKEFPWADTSACSFSPR